MSELDKFKRRTIRSVARLLLKEKKPPEELWAEMKKETGTDCRVLWERMRALCVKKLNRMIAVDDRSAHLPNIARLSLTDWLLVDLVLVHEKIDVIMMEKSESKEYPALIELFNLVQRFDVEGRKGSELAEAWAAATVHYNRQGRQCSPMLLQRRWHQLKKLTRCRFYKFWHAYKGNSRLLPEARKAMPTRLQMAIAKRYPKVITQPFPDWEELVEQGLIIMPEEFEAKMRMPNLPKPCDSNAPDLLLVEPVIETIDVDSDPDEHSDDFIEDTSDPEKSNDATDINNPTNDEQTIENNEALGIKVKTEPVEQDGLSNVQVSSATHVPEVEIPDESPEESPGTVSPTDAGNVDAGETLMDNSLGVDEHDDIIDLPTDNNDTTAEVPKISVSRCRIENSSDIDEDDIIEIPSLGPDCPNLKLPADNIIGAVTAEVPPKEVRLSSNEGPVIDGDEIVDDIIKVKADEFCRKSTEKLPSEEKVIFSVDDLIKDKVETFLRKPKEDVTFVDKKPDISNTNFTNKRSEVAAIDLMADLNFIDDGIEFVDDGIEFVEEDATQKIDSTIETSPSDKYDEDVEENKTFDLKLLMDPVVYTTKLDQMKIFTNKSFITVNNVVDIEMAVLESKPVSKKSFNMNVKQECVTSISGDTEHDDDLFVNREETDEDEDEKVMEDVAVSPNSYMLKKPRTRSYNPIKLCKNPDFNTKLKRLTIGFLSSTRNRQLLNACIPMTIDLSKTFESKLFNGTLYLKSSGQAPLVTQGVTDKQASSIVPSAMSVQSLIDNSKTDILNLISNQTASPPIISERTKVINLPDIDKVRKINQQLLTAQVPPIRVYAGNSNKSQPSQTTPPGLALQNEAEVFKEYAPEIYSTVSNTTPIASSTLSTKPVSEPTIITSETINIVPVNQSTLATVVKVESDAIVDQKTIGNTADTISPPETLPPAKEKLLKIINQAKISTQEELVKIDKSTKLTAFPKPIVVNKVKADIPQEVPRKYSYPRVPVAWAPKYAQGPKNLDDFLLTNDTLYKMLHTLMYCNKEGKNCSCYASKPKKAKKELHKGMKQKMSHKSESVQEKQSEPAQKDEADRKTTQDPPVSAKVNLDESPPVATAKKPVLARGRVIRYCCWAKQKLYNRKRITKHTCLPSVCKCCCRDLLAVKIFEDEQKRAKELEMRKKDESIELSDDEQASLKKACESIENVVQQSRELNSTNSMQGITPDGPPVTVSAISICTNVDPMPAASQSSEKTSVDIVLSPTRPLIQNPTTPPKPPCVITHIRAAPNSIAPLIVQKRTEPRLINPRIVKPCFCQKLALSQDSQRNIVIDASKNCPIHPKPIAPKQDKVLYLHSKSLAKGPSESPIFLGKNKILLTTVKFPRKSEEVAPQSETFLSPKIIPTLPLPTGVQLVLMPSGCVTYTLDPGVELDKAQLASLPTIIAAVQEQLNATGHPKTPMNEPASTSEMNITETIDLAQTEDDATETPLPDSNITIGSSHLPQASIITETQNTTEVPPLVSLKTNEVFQDADLPPNVSDKENMEIDITERTHVDASSQETITSNTENVTIPLTEDTISTVTKDSEVPIDNTLVNNEPIGTSTIPSVGESGVQNETQTEETQSLEENKEETENPNDKEGMNNRKTLLSDLMEMSGISAEDTAAPEPPVTEPPSTENVETTANLMMNADQARNLPELSPVTSFAELKYACEQNGKFFKLDFESGVIVPINVCIKKNPKNKIPQKPKEYIDLTDDAGSTETVSTASRQLTEPIIVPGSSLLKSPVEYSYNGKTLSVSSTVKPVKLFRAFRPTPTVLKRSSKLIFDSPIASKRTHLEKRKQSLNKVEAKIDLVDSDEPMEEEYLVDSSSDDSRPGFEPTLMEADALGESDDSSDDEPLAKKFRRLIEPDAEKEENVKVTNIYDEIPDEAPHVPEPSELTLSVRKNLNAILDKPSLAEDNGKLENPAPEVPPPTPLGSNPVPTVGKDSVSSVSVRTDLVPSANESNEALTVSNEDEDFDKDEQPELRFLFDQTDSESGEEDCILGV